MTQQDHKPDYIIRKRRSSQWYWTITLCILGLMAISVVLGYWLNSKKYDFSETAEQQFSQLQESLKESNANVVKWQQQFQVEKSVNQELRQHTMQLELKMNALNKEVQAYQRIFDPDSVESGMQIASFTWENRNAREFAYRLVLIQAKNQVLNINGKFALSLVGNVEGQEQELSFNELEGVTDKDRKFRFKYMEARIGIFVIPENFDPKLIRVSVTSSGKNGKSILQDFSWNQSLSVNNNQTDNTKADSNEPIGGT